MKKPARSYFEGFGFGAGIATGIVIAALFFRAANAVLRAAVGILW